MSIGVLFDLQRPSPSWTDAKPRTKVPPHTRAVASGIVSTGRTVRHKDTLADRALNEAALLEHQHDRRNRCRANVIQHRKLAIGRQFVTRPMTALTAIRTLRPLAPLRPIRIGPACRVRNYGTGWSGMVSWPPKSALPVVPFPVLGAVEGKHHRT